MARQAETVADVIDDLTGIVDWSKNHGSPLGYFAALYRKVTIEVKRGIDDGRFDDGPRMERLDVLFARRYLDAFASFRDGGRPSRSWVFAFDVTEQWWPIVLQHLLLGMNAHINLDLGIAAARTVPPEQLPDLRGDFDEINEVLASLVGGVQEELAQVWPALRPLNRYLSRTQGVLINFSMEKARDHAWEVAERLAPLGMSEQSSTIERLDGDVVDLAHLIRHPGIVAGTVTKLVRLGERGSVRRIIDVLE